MSNFKKFCFCEEKLYLTVGGFSGCGGMLLSFSVSPFILHNPYTACDIAILARVLLILFFF